MSIEFEAKTDRELLVLVAQQGNQAVIELKRLNGTLGKHEERLTKLERRPFNVNWQSITIILSVVALAMANLGERVGWW